jgi:hypothetical protein
VQLEASLQPDLRAAWRQSLETVVAARFAALAGAAAQFCEALVWMHRRKLPEAPGEGGASAVLAR